MEMVTDQFVNRFRPPPEEDIYRLVTNLLNDALQVSLSSSLGLFLL